MSSDGRLNHDGFEAPRAPASDAAPAAWHAAASAMRSPAPPPAGASPLPSGRKLPDKSALGADWIAANFNRGPGKKLNSADALFAHSRTQPGRGIAHEPPDDRPVWRRLAPLDTWSKLPSDAAASGASGARADDHSYAAQPSHAAPWRAYGTRRPPRKLKTYSAASAGLGVTLAGALALLVARPDPPPALDMARAESSAPAQESALQVAAAPAAEAPAPPAADAAPRPEIAPVETTASSPAQPPESAAATAPAAPAATVVPDATRIDIANAVASSVAAYAAYGLKTGEEGARKTDAVSPILRKKPADRVRPAAAAKTVAAKPKIRAAADLARAKPKGPIEDISRAIDAAGTGAQTGLTTIGLGIKRLFVPRRG